MYRYLIGFNCNLKNILYQIWYNFEAKQVVKIYQLVQNRPKIGYNLEYLNSSKQIQEKSLWDYNHIYTDKSSVITNSISLESLFIKLSKPCWNRKCNFCKNWHLAKLFRKKKSWNRWSLSFKWINELSSYKIKLLVKVRNNKVRMGMKNYP